MSALIFGHSFVARHNTFLNSHPSLRASLNCQQVSKITFRGYGGLKVYDERFVQLLSRDLHDFHPNFLIIDMGSNDCGTSRDLTEVSAMALELFLKVLTAINDSGISTPKVIFLEQHKRTALHPSSVVSMEQFNRHIEVFNIEMGRITRNRYISVDSVKSAFFRFRRMRLNWAMNLSDDGVHLNEQGNKRYMRNLKGALLMVARM